MAAAPQQLNSSDCAIRVHTTIARDLAGLPLEHAYLEDISDVDKLTRTAIVQHIAQYGVGSNAPPVGEVLSDTSSVASVESPHSLSPNTSQYDNQLYQLSDNNVSTQPAVSSINSVAYPAAVSSTVSSPLSHHTRVEGTLLPQTSSGQFAETNHTDNLERSRATGAGASATTPTPVEALATDGGQCSPHLSSKRTPKTAAQTARSLHPFFTNRMDGKDLPSAHKCCKCTKGNCSSCVCGKASGCTPVCKSTGCKHRPADWAVSAPDLSDIGADRPLSE